MPGIVLVGLGVGGPEQLAAATRDLLAGAAELSLRTRVHDALKAMKPATVTTSFDELLDRWDPSVDAVAVIASKVLELGRRPQGVAYAVPGHPLISDSTCAAIIDLAEREGLDVTTVGGASFLEVAFSALGLIPASQLTILDALDLARVHVPSFPPSTPALITQLHSSAVASAVKAAILALFPRRHVVSLVHHRGSEGGRVEQLALEEIDSSPLTGPLTCLFVPPLEAGASIEDFQEVVAHLRAPDGCPWDREQTHASLRRHLLEEAYEAIAAMDAGEPEAMQEELGDLLLQIVLNAQIASEHGDFTFNDVSMGVRNKIIRRHPHVFGDFKVDGLDSVLTNWERLKETERGGKERGGGLLEGVPLALPALGQAQEYQERAARVGFDWPEIQGVLDKIAEEIQEVKRAKEADALGAELGDLLFALVNLSRWKGIDAESALRGANLRFRKRFGFIEERARRSKQRLSDLTLDEMESLWQQAKASGL
jgi:tetrapyrrole methylase family protein/MazG family protein